MRRIKLSETAKNILSVIWNASKNGKGGIDEYGVFHELYSGPDHHMWEGEYGNVIATMFSLNQRGYTTGEMFLEQRITEAGIAAISA